MTESGLDSGANDYMIRLFSFSELLARVRAQLRQHHALNSTLEISGLRMDSVSQSVSRDNISITLTLRVSVTFGCWLQSWQRLYRTVIAVKFGRSTLIVIPSHSGYRHSQAPRKKLMIAFPEKLIAPSGRWAVHSRGKKIMKRLSITVRLTFAFLYCCLFAGAGCSGLYNGCSELKWRDDTTLINRTAQIKQLLIDGVNPDTLPVHFNRMMDVSQDILIIHGDSINKIVNRTNVSDGMLNNIPASETISAAGIYKALLMTQR